MQVKIKHNETEITISEPEATLQYQSDKILELIECCARQVIKVSKSNE
jgi:hypothetical protein